MRATQNVILITAESRMVTQNINDALNSIDESRKLIAKAAESIRQAVLNDEIDSALSNEIRKKTVELSDLYSKLYRKIENQVR
jgi:hypothetical protein